MRGGYGELCNGVDGAGAGCHVVGAVGAVGVAKAGGAVCTMVVSGTKGVVIVGTRWGAGTACGAVVNDANDKDGVAEAGGMSEEDEDHVGCNGEGCPNKCALGAWPRRRSR